LEEILPAREFSSATSSEARAFLNS